MSEQELYALAQQRVSRRHRRWMWFGLDLAILILTLAALILLGSTGNAIIGVTIFIGWGAVFVFHSIWIGFAETRESDIEKEVARLHAALEYEKPKRLGLSDDGELVDVANEADEPAQAKHSR